MDRARSVPVRRKIEIVKCTPIGYDRRRLSQAPVIARLAERITVGQRVEYRARCRREEHWMAGPAAVVERKCDVDSVVHKRFNRIDVRGGYKWHVSKQHTRRAIGWYAIQREAQRMHHAAFR
jgi:hypothetical protein